jgi:hypothetical protein
MKLTTLLKLLERSNIPNKEELKEQLLTAYEKYKTGEASRTDVERVITIILKQLDIDMSMPVRRMKRVEDEPAPDDEIPPDDQVVEVKDEVIEDDYYVGGRRVRRSWMNWRT